VTKSISFHNRYNVTLRDETHQYALIVPAGILALGDETAANLSKS
jgi:hypothetical protein